MGNTLLFLVFSFSKLSIVGVLDWWFGNKKSEYVTMGFGETTFLHLRKYTD